MQAPAATQHPDLFPETLLVSREGERIYTTTRSVAFYFGKKHKNVLNSAENVIAGLSVMQANGPNFRLISTQANGLNFQPIATPEPAGGERNFSLTSPTGEPHFWPSEYTDKRNRKKPEYQMSEEGFALLAMGFTGDEALYWKWAFLQQFMQLRAEAAERQAIRVNALHILHPSLLPTVEDFEGGLPRIYTAQRLGKSPASVTYYRRKARGLGLLPEHAARGQA